MALSNRRLRSQSFVMLAKNEAIERRIGLMSTLLNGQARWGLIERLLDCGTSCGGIMLCPGPHTMPLARGHIDQVHRCSLFVDLSTFV